MPEPSASHAPGNRWLLLRQEHNQVWGDAREIRSQAAQIQPNAQLGKSHVPQEPEKARVLHGLYSIEIDHDLVLLALWG